MKILHVRIHNINSLRGVHEVPMDKYPLNDASIYLISGPTGSGKTTILDAITLALFNRIPRLSSAISNSTVETMGALVTRNEREAAAMVRYEVKGIVYESKWEIKKNRNDNWNPYHLEIFNVTTGLLIDANKGTVPKINEDIIGLSYDQFLKAIILSQGDFDQFLKSNHSDRGVLLEKLTGTEIYRYIGQKVYELHKQEVAKLELLEQKMTDIHLPSDEVLNSHLDTINVFTKEVETISKEIAQLSELKEIKRQIASNQKQLASALALEAKLLEEKTNKAITFKKLQQFQILTPYIQDMEEVRQYQKEWTKVKTQKETNNGKLVNAENRLQLLLDEMATLTQKDINQANFINEMKSLESTFSTITNEINTLKKQANAAIEEVLQRTPAYLKLPPNPKSQDIIHIVESELNDIAQLKDQIPASNDKTEEELSFLIDELDEVIHLQAHIHQAEKEITGLQQEMAQLNQHLLEQQSLNTQWSIKIASLQKSIDDLEIEYKAFRERLSLEQFRLELEEGKPCPLCGSTTHPMAIHQEVVEEGTFSLKLRTLKDDIKKAQSSHTLAVSSIASLTAKIEAHEKRIAQLNEQIGPNQEALVKLLPKYDQDIVQNQMHKEATVALFKALKAYNSRATRVDILKSIQLRCQQIVQMGLDYLEKTKERDALYKGDLLEVTNNLQNEFSTTIEQLTSLKSLATSLDHRDEELHQGIKKMQELLLPKLKAIGFNDLDHAYQAMLPNEEYELLKQEQDKISQSLHEVSATLTTLRGQLMELTEKDQAELPSEYIESDLEAKNLLVKNKLLQVGAIRKELELHQANKVKLHLLSKERDTQAQITAKFKYLNILIGDATGNKFSNYAQDLTLKTLLVIANKHLKKLTDRYELKLTNLEDDLTIYDLYQGDAERAVKTLSGGETFLLSLAMAVSLSELASREVLIQSIFIDEGFGTLDEDSLDQAIVALETLQTTSNKTIGIISHVASLKDRIHTKINLTRDVKGFSRIEIK